MPQCVSAVSLMHRGFVNARLQSAYFLFSTEFCLGPHKTFSTKPKCTEFFCPAFPYEEIR